MTYPSQSEPSERDRRAVVLVLLLAFLLAGGTAWGVGQALTDTSNDRVKGSSTAPVYGSR